MDRDHGARSAAVECAGRLSALANPVRLAVVLTLCHGPLGGGQIQAVLHVERDLLAREVAKLRTAGLVVARRDGRSLVFSLGVGVRVNRGR